MKKNIIKSIILLMIPFSLIGCNKKKEETITNKEESTIIKNAKSADEYLKKQDYKSIAYAFIYNIKEGLQSYESETNGTIKAKVMFFDYNIKYNSVTFKSGNVFYSKDHSTSTFTNVQNEFYMVNRDKILASRDLKKYDVYTMEDYKKVSYAPNQYTIMGYVFTDQSIIKTELLSDKADNISIKYTLDNELATNFVKTDLKVNGDLSGYPKFDSIEITLSMKRDFTPISYGINAIYDASKPVIGSSKVRQEGECLFSKVNEKISIPNEQFLIEKLGEKPSEVVIDDGGIQLDTELLKAVGDLPFSSGVNVSGALTLDFLGSKMALNINADVTFDIKRLSTDILYNLLSAYVKIEGDENFNALLSLVKQFAGDKLGDYAQLLEGFKSVEAVYDGAGAIYLIPTNKDNVHLTMLKIKLVDVADLLLQNINIYNLISGANADLFSLRKIEGSDSKNFQVEITLAQDAIESIRNTLNKLFEDSTYSMLKTLLGYKDFDSIKVTIGVVNGVLSSLDASANYIKTSDTVTTIASLHLEAKGQEFDFESKINSAKELYTAYNSVQELKTRINYIINNIYVNRAYLATVTTTLEEFNALNDAQKDFIGRSLGTKLESIKKEISDIYTFLDELAKYDLNNLTNQDILNLAKAYKEANVKGDLLKGEIGEEKYNKLNHLGESVDYSAFNSAVTKMTGEDETAWGLTEEEIRGIKLLFDISKYEDSIKTQMLMTMLLSGITTDFSLDQVDAIETKINNLYNQLP